MVDQRLTGLVVSGEAAVAIDAATRFLDAYGECRHHPGQFLRSR